MIAIPMTKKTHNIQIRIARPEDMDLCAPALLELRPHLNREILKDRFITQQKEGYKMIFIGDDRMVFALAGFRSLNMFFTGKTLYIDDLVTHSDYKMKGYASLLLEWIKNYAEENNYDHLSLDSGFQRKDAYRLYLNKGLEVESLHFGRKVSEL